MQRRKFLRTAGVGGAAVGLLAVDAVVVQRHDVAAGQLGLLNHGIVAVARTGSDCVRRSFRRVKT